MGEKREHEAHLGMREGRLKDAVDRRTWGIFFLFANGLGRGNNGSKVAQSPEHGSNTYLWIAIVFFNIFLDFFSDLGGRFRFSPIRLIYVSMAK